MEFRIISTLLCIIAFLQTTAEARAGKNRIKLVQSDTPQSEYDEYDGEYDYDYENGLENNRSE